MTQYVHIAALIALLSSPAILAEGDVVQFNSGVSTFVSTFQKDVPHDHLHQGGIRYTRLRSPGARKGLFRWDVGAPPFGDRPIAQARAYFYCGSSRNPGNDTITAHEMLRPWTPEATWLETGKGLVWGAPGLKPDVDYRAASIGVMKAASAGGVWLELVLDPGRVESWFRNPVANVGIMLQAPKNTGDGIDCLLASFAARQEDLRPRLVVAADDGAVLTVPVAKAPADACEYRFYDPDLDPSSLPLDQVRIRYAGLRETTWGDIAIPARSSWPVWSKDGSLRVIVTRGPLTVDKPFYRKGEGFDAWGDTNDNFGGHWWSPDSKTLFYGQSRTVRRFAPYRVEYDNLRQVNRIMVVWSTQDGIHWTPDWFDVPNDAESTAFQNYGLRVIRTADPELLVCYNCAYDQWRQQIYTTLHFSHDGRYWDHIPGQLTAVPPGQPGSWNFGSMFLSGRSVSIDGRTFQGIGHANSGCHFYHELRQGKTQDAATVKRRFEKRELDKNWPHFDAIGGWQGLAEHVQESGYTIGVAEWREDGLVALHAEATETFTTRALTNADTLAINAATGKRGSVTIEVLGPDQQELNDYCGTNASRFTGDSVRHDASWSSGTLTTLPDGVFRLRVTLQDADLYALYW